jgi:hypothetical protein
MDRRLCTEYAARVRLPVHGVTGGQDLHVPSGASMPLFANRSRIADRLWWFSARARPSVAAAVALLPLASCGDPTAPGSLVGTYRLAYVSEGRGIQRPPVSFGIYQSSAVLRVVGGSLTLRADSTYELRWAASRDSTGSSVALPPVLASGRYRAIPTNGDNAFDYHLEFTINERPDETFTASRDNFDGDLPVCCLIVETVGLSFIFDP